MEITPEDETGSFSIVHVKTRDRPGLLTEIVRTLKDLNVNVISAEVGNFCFSLPLAGNAVLLHDLLTAFGFAWCQHSGWGSASGLCMCTPFTFCWCCAD